MVILSEYVIRQANHDQDTSLTPLVKGFINDQAFVNEKISSMSLAYLSILTAEGFGHGDTGLVYDALKNRIDIDGRGAYLPNISTANRSYFETPIKNTALLLKAFSAHEDEHPAMANVLRWLLASRDSRGAWGGTHNTFNVVDAMVDYLKWQHETESHFTLRGVLDGVEVFGHEFNSSNIFETFTHNIALGDLPQDELLPLVFDKENHNELQNNMYYDMSMKYFLPVESIPPRDEGITITRALYELDDGREESPIYSAVVGDVVKGKIELTIPDQYSHVSVEDIIPAGFEIVNFNLSTEDQSLKQPGPEGKGSLLPSKDDNWFARINNSIENIFGVSQTAQLYRSYGNGGSYRNKTRTLYPSHIESHDDRVFLYVESLSPGVYEYEYYLRALVPGEFQHLPARAEELFFPEVFGRTDGGTIKIIEED
jgi:hypothetical protein